MSRSAERVIAAVLYADIFDYPLTEEEARLWSGVAPFPSGPLRGLERVDSFVIRAGRQHIIALRKQRERFSAAKWEQARRVGALLGRIPTVMLVGITGGLSVNNADKQDDIDFLIIARQGTLWATRLAATLLLDCLGLRRKPGAPEVANKACLNMFLSDDSLSLPVSERDLFSAHEVLQMAPVFDRGNTYGAFLHANRWVRQFAPLMWRRVRKRARPLRRRWLSPVGAALCAVEPLVRATQLWYMQQRRTNEVIRPGQIRFHPRDARAWIRAKLGKRLRQWRIPLDKIFYHP